MNNIENIQNNPYLESIIFPRSFERKEIVEGSESTFIVSSLHKGYGATIGNIFRRILLSSIRGVAVASLKSDKFLNLYSSVEGIKEECFAIALNISKLILKMDNAESSVLTLSVSKAGSVYASNITHNPNVQILNKDLYLFTVNENIDLNIEIHIESGIGYKKAASASIVNGLLELDRIYSPIENVSFEVFNVIGSSDDHVNDKLELTIKTNGTIDPKSALGMASVIAREFFACFTDFPDMKINIEKKDKDSDESFWLLMDESVEILDLHVRAANCLRRSKIRKIGELITMSELELLRTPNFGKKSLDQIKESLAEKGLRLGMTLLRNGETWKATHTNEDDADLDSDSSYDDDSIE